ncbi:hypothetical protein N581_00390 [Lactobacillus jensenii MD IIE-70(2)]|nr:hypothetical protein N581_00390 [Lactobacillus jensenii MD IIE-70(2)]
MYLKRILPFGFKKKQNLSSLTPKLIVKEQNKVKKGSIVAKLVYKLDKRNSVKINLIRK